MRRTVMCFLYAAGVGCILAGCASPRPRARVEESESVLEAATALEGTFDPQQDPYNASIDDGLEQFLAALNTPMSVRYMSRTVGMLTQVTSTRVGGDNSIDASPAEDLVVFSSDRHGPYSNIYTKHPAGKTVTQKTFEPFDEVQPAFSPDGRRIAFASNKGGSYDIWIIETHSNGTAQQVTFGPENEVHPSWTPDGRAIVYSRRSILTGEWDIMLTDLSTGEVSDIGRGKFPEVSPDGTRILFQRARKREGYWYSIWTMSIDGTDQTEIIASADWAAINPCWSPDGQFIAFASVHKSPQAKFEERVWRADDIYVVATNGRGLQQVTSDTEAAWDPCWSAKDGRLYFISERDGSRNVWSIKVPIFAVASSPRGAESQAK